MRYKKLDNIELSELGVGTYLGELDEETDRRYEETIKLALEKGINVVDTAINYRYMKSERVIGRVIKEAGRESLFISTKGGYIPFDAQTQQDPKDFFEENFIRTRIVDPNEMTPQGHYLGGKFIEWCFEKSLQNMETEYIDVYFLHNPEEQLLFTEREEFLKRVGECFAVLEEKVREGKLKYYGVATWQGFRIPKGARQYLSVSELLDLAKDIAGDNHHFKVIQLPYNLGMHEAFSMKNQEVKGKVVSTLEACEELGVYVYTSASLYQGNVIGRIPANLKERFGLEKDVLVALQFVRSTPGVGTALVGMSRVEHLEENLEIEQIEPLGREEFLSLFK